MIRALVSGTLYGDPEQRVAKSGSTYTTAKLRADGKDGSSVWCSLIAFGDQAERLMTLKANAALSVSGKAELQAWLSKTGEPAAGLSLVIDDLAVLKPKPRPKESYPQAQSDPQQRFNGPKESYPQAQGEPPPRSNGNGPRPFAPAPAGFDDMDRWRP
jgi:single-stranded DNA-binding protein